MAVIIPVLLISAIVLTIWLSIKNNKSCSSNFKTKGFSEKGCCTIERYGDTIKEEVKDK